MSALAAWFSTAMLIGTTDGTFEPVAMVELLSLEPNSTVLAERYLAKVGSVAEAPTLPEAAAWLAAALHTARAAWPTIALDATVYVEHLARHYRAGGQWRELEVSDLFLARACANGDAAALLQFEPLLHDVDKAVAQLGLGPADRDEVIQSVRELLFVAPAGKEPHILRYAGRGSLRGWARSVAVRTALKSRRGPQASSIDEEVFLEFSVSIEDQELVPYKQRYRDDFRAAFRDAIEALSVRERNLLRQYYLDGLGIDELGAMYRVHRSTAARWIVDVREVLQSRVRTALEQRLQLSGSDLESLLALVRSQLEVSFERLMSVP